MSISNDKDLNGMREVSEAVAQTLKRMTAFAAPGMTTKELDLYGGEILKSYGARSAPKLAYKFPGYTCISINDEVAHGVPKPGKFLKEGDLINIDVSAELNGYWSDNGGSFILGEDLTGKKKLVDASRDILEEAIAQITSGLRIAELGRFIEEEARRRGYKVIRNLVGHGIGRSLHEAPREIPCFYDKSNVSRFKKNTVVAVETFISTKAAYTVETADGWTLKTPDGSYVAQHEHTLIVTEGRPVILTMGNGIFD